MEKITKLFNKEHNIIIGALHFAPLLGYADSPGKDQILKDALADLDAFEKGGIDAIIIENNYDVPHIENISKENLNLVIEIGKVLKEKSKLPFGVSILWNDYRSAFIIAKAIGAKFIRVPVFVDSVRTSYGEFLASPKKVLEARQELDAEDILIFADIQVKHAEMLEPRPLVDSVNEAIRNGADGLIITGNWTGDSPKTTDLQIAREQASNFPIIAGSGVDKVNAKTILHFANAAIVSTSLKEGEQDSNEVNLMKWSQRVSQQKTSELVKSTK